MLNIGLFLASILSIFVFGGAHGDNSELFKIMSVLLPIQVLLWWWYLRYKQSSEYNNKSWLLIIVVIIILIVFCRSVF